MYIMDLEPKFGASIDVVCILYSIVQNDFHFDFTIDALYFLINLLKYSHKLFRSHAASVGTSVCEG